MAWNGWQVFRGNKAGAGLMDDDEEARRFGPITILPDRHEVRVHDEAVVLTAMEMSILTLLASRPGVVFSPERIAEVCHDGHAQVQARSVNRRVQALRKKLGEAGELIANRRGLGYCLVAVANDPDGDTSGGGRAWSLLAPLLVWWAQRSGRGQLWTMGAVLGSAGLLGVGGWLAHEAIAPPPGTRGAELTAAGVWRPVQQVDSEDPLAYLKRVSGWSGVGSSLVYTGHADEYLVLGDRGYESGRDNPVCRWHRVRIEAPAGDAADGPAELRITPLSQTVLRDEAGRPLRGGSDDLVHRYDPEAMCLDAAGNVWIAEEYGPSIDLFSPDGTRLRRLPIPEHLRVAHPHPNPDKERRYNVVGRTPNRGFEALALDEDQGVLWAMTQAPLIQDGSEGGAFVRLLALSVDDGRLIDEWVYPLEAEEHQVSAMLWRGGELWVLERDLLAGHKRVYAVRVDGATPVTGIASLPSNRLPMDIEPVDKRLVLDVLTLAREAEEQGVSVYEQFEGMAFGPTRPDGRARLLVSTDNSRAGVYVGEVMSVYQIELSKDALASTAIPAAGTIALTHGNHPPEK